MSLLILFCILMCTETELMKNMQYVNNILTNNIIWIPEKKCGCVIIFLHQNNLLILPLKFSVWGNVHRDVIYKIRTIQVSTPRLPLSTYLSIHLCFVQYKNCTFLLKGDTCFPQLHFIILNFIPFFMLLWAIL